MSRSDVQLPSELVVPLAQAGDVELAGGKAAGLAAAIARGHRVPDGVVIPVGAPPADRLGPALVGVVERLGGSVAVRSSAVGEDGLHASYAGQYETVLAVTDDDALFAAIAACRASADSAAVLDYAAHAHADAGETAIAVLVQRMVDAEAAGVAFSIDPITGHDHVVIEATAGVGDALLSGAATGERWTVDGPPRCVTTPRIVLDENRAEEIAGLCHRLVDETGGPVDIEWAIEDGELLLLQVRPVTVVPVEPAVVVPDGQTFVREPRFALPVDPLSFTSWLPLHSEAFTHTFARFGIPVDTVDHRHLFGRVYTRTVMVGDRGKDGPPPPDLVMKALFRLMPPIRRRMNAARQWIDDDAIDALVDHWELHRREWTHASTRALRERDLSALSDGELADHLDELRAHVLQVAEDHFDLVVGAMYMSMGRLGLFVEDRLGWSLHDVFALVQGYGTASTAHGEAIGDLARALGPAGVAAALEDPSTLLDHPAAAAYLDEWGHRVNIGLARPTEVEQPSLIAAHLRRHATSPRSAGDLTAAADAAAERARSQLTGTADRERFDQLVRLARRARPTGDETEGTVLGALANVRFAALEAGGRFETAERLRDRRDVFFLERDEVVAMLRSHSAPVPDLERRKSEYRWAQANPYPDHIGPKPVTPNFARLVPKSHRDTVGAVVWAVNASEPARATHVESDGSALLGIPGSPGVVEGPARIVHDLSESARIEPGDIVVCPVTQASWSPVFGAIGGLVTEHGGPLSHPGTLAREYGIPCVLAVAGAVSSIQDGALIRVDGTTGRVELRWTQTG